MLLVWAHLVAGVGFAVQAADRGEPAKIDGRAVSLLVREAVARAALWTLGLGVWFRSDGWRSSGKPTVPAGVDRRPPCLLVPGLSLNQASMWGLRTFLLRRGWRQVQTTERVAADGTLAAEAEGLARRVRALTAAAGADKVDLVGFGTGGLVVAWYLKHHGADHVRRVVTIGTPWRGTKLSVFVRGAAAAELRYGGHVLDGLTPLPVPTVCIWSPDDPVVVPASSAVPESGADAVRVDAAGHVDLLLSARVYRAVQAALDRPLVAPRESDAPSPTLVPVPEPPVTEALSPSTPVPETSG